MNKSLKLFLQKRPYSTVVIIIVAITLFIFLRDYWINRDLSTAFSVLLYLMVMWWTLIQLRKYEIDNCSKEAKE